MPDDRNFSQYLLREGESVMEVKVTGSVPYWLPRMLGDVGCILTSHSKYCNALEAGDSALLRKASHQPEPAAKTDLDPVPGGDSPLSAAFS